MGKFDDYNDDKINKMIAELEQLTATNPKPQPKKSSLKNPALKGGPALKEGEKNKVNWGMAEVQDKENPAIIVLREIVEHKRDVNYKVPLLRLEEKVNLGFGSKLDKIRVKLSAFKAKVKSFINVKSSKSSKASDKGHRR